MGEEPTLAEVEENDATRAETPDAREGARSGPSGSPPSVAPSIATLTPQSAERTLSIGAGGGTTTITQGRTPQETLLYEEVGRTRIFIRYALAVGAVITLLSTIVHGDPVAQRIVYSGTAVVCGFTLWFAWQLRTDAGYTLGRAMAAALACIYGAFCGIWFFGVYSPAVIILPFGLYFFSIGRSFRATFGVYLVCAVVYLALLVGVGAGVLRDAGIVRGDRLAHTDRIVLGAVVQLTLLATFLVARRMRQTTARAIELHDRAVRGLALRQALLEEARLDLQQALKSGGLGRFTDTQLGSFRIGKMIGRGAMGEVYEAKRVGTGEAAAVKLLQAHVLANPDLVRRFLREAKIASSLDVPNVVRVFEIGGLEGDSAPFPYIAMERLRGRDLAEHLQLHRRLSIARAVTLIREVGRGLDAARDAGIVHRDLKPRNVFLAESGIGGARRTWKILDFGVSKLMDSERTQTGAVIGTPAYMAPEQARGLAVSHRTDLYALGVIAYRVLTGRPAFTGEQTPEILYQVVYQMPPKPSAGLPTLPSEVDLVLAVAMAKDEKDRFESASAFADALDAASRGEIDPHLRARADALLAKHAWGAQLRAQASSSA